MAATESSEDVGREFWDRLNSSIASVTLASLGLTMLHARFEELIPPAKPSDVEEPRVYIGGGEPNDPETRAPAMWARSDLLAHTAAGGQAHVVLGRQWLVAFYQEWEDDLRPRWAAALGLPNTADLKIPVMGDLRLMRNDIIHGRGVAQRCARCEVLRWFVAGDQIVITEDHFLQLRRALGHEGFRP